ncbi:dioxygenase [Microbacterium sp. CJ88]|uniref:dioxygenase n=1 Tax=Microbacterium sp. CJ88 TaxID=3445672 RepID=UPI003F65EC71
MSTGGRDRGTRAERERVRVYQARQSLHDAQIRRRTRDNVIAAVVGGVLILGVTGGQIAYYTLGPGVPPPASPSPSPSPSPTGTSVPAPLLPTPAPTAS